MVKLTQPAPVLSCHCKPEMLPEMLVVNTTESPGQMLMLNGCCANMGGATGVKLSTKGSCTCPCVPAEPGCAPLFPAAQAVD